MTECKIMRIDNKLMKGVLRREQKLANMFVAHLLTRNIRYEEDLVDQFSIRTKNAWPEFCCYWRVSARMAWPRRPRYAKSAKQPWQRWWVRRGRESTIL